MRIGIDPDIKGGVAVVRNGTVIDLFDIPTMPGLSKRRKVDVDSSALQDLLEGIISEFHDGTEYLCINIEHVHSTPQMGVVSAFKFGQTFGQIYGAALATGKPVKMITPQKWKRLFGLLKKPKDASRVLAIDHYPRLENKLKRKKDVGKADALWIALS